MAMMAVQGWMQCNKLLHLDFAKFEPKSERHFDNYKPCKDVVREPSWAIRLLEFRECPRNFDTHSLGHWLRVHSQEIAGKEASNLSEVPLNFLLVADGGCMKPTPDTTVKQK